MGESRLHYGMSLRLYFEEKAFGPGMVMLLREVERTGSLQKAAKNMNMAYSKAWKMLKGCLLYTSSPWKWGIFTWSINPAEKAVSLSTRESRDADEGQNGKRDRLHAVFHYRPV